MKRFVCILLILSLAAVYPLYSFFASRTVAAVPVDTADGLAALERFDQVNLDRVQEKLDKIEAKRLEALEKENRRLRVDEILRLIDAGKLSYRKALKDVYIAGDSLMEGLSAYDILNGNHIIAQVSASLAHLEENFDKIVSIHPPVLLLHYGLNMIATDDLHLQIFIQQYTRLILRLQKSLPHTRIVVSLLFPVDTSVATAKRFKRIAKYNKALTAMCEDLGVEALNSKDAFYVDGNLDTQYYGADGIHLSGAFYRNIWLKYIIRNLEIGA